MIVDANVLHATGEETSRQFRPVSWGGGGESHQNVTAPGGSASLRLIHRMLVEPARERQRTAVSKPPGGRETHSDPECPQTPTGWFRLGLLLRRSPAQPASERP